ncbi:hypothetical protein RFI_10663 [Reticulomyxa filosa]|uniref:Uncharacterized protein n=1 Tax=Reticulomyxa filosa TaxID=46433 RepID=X6NJJ6_RETFI|nr:hypothetical protein RFI_10663 [Reticulomyxa filosa]|eukprot:ETO26475.1 hypothetical protein RFI_10663 [Reticulomyxa filosa]
MLKDSFGLGGETKSATEVQSTAVAQSAAIDENNNVPGANANNAPGANVNDALAFVDNRKKEDKSRRAVRTQKINTNVVAFDLGTLGDKANAIATGDPVVCANAKCKAILSGIDILKTSDKDMKVDDDDSIWICQLCNQRNIIQIQNEEIPQGDTVDYIVEPSSEDEKSDLQHNVMSLKSNTFFIIIIIIIFFLCLQNMNTEQSFYT